MAKCDPTRKFFLAIDCYTKWVKGMEMTTGCDQLNPLFDYTEIAVPHANQRPLQGMNVGQHRMSLTYTATQHWC